MVDIGNVIDSAPEEMKGMLESVYSYNAGFVYNEEQESLLERILFAMSVIDRKYFVPDSMYTYQDDAQPIGEGQTISQPRTVARMLMLAELARRNSVLEVGTGSGWNACLAAFLVYPGKVVSLERIYDLLRDAERNVYRLRTYLEIKRPSDFVKIKNINFLAESVFKRGKVWMRRYDKIIITAGIKQGDEEKIEDLARSLLKPKGILICPYITGPLLIYRRNGKLRRETTNEGYGFVPLLD